MKLTEEEQRFQNEQCLGLFSEEKQIMEGFDLFNIPLENTQKME